MNDVQEANVESTSGEPKVKVGVVIYQETGCKKAYCTIFLKATGLLFFGVKLMEINSNCFVFRS